jgi:pimeloyl-ACP methyl ester carboxylesterase
MAIEVDGVRSRFEVRSPDGVPLTVWVAGTGPPVVLVHGSIADHTTFDLLVAALRPDMTTFSPDRRGFGASGDATGYATGYAIEREFADIAAIVDAVAARAGRPVTLWGHSYGASCALGAAARTGAIERLVLYEPSLGLAYPEGAIERIEAALAAGDREAALTVVLRDLLGMGDDEIDAYRAGPRWPDRLAAAPTVPRECRAEQEWTYRPGQFDAIAARTVVLTGSESPPELIATARRAARGVPGAEVRVLPGHGHLAHHHDPALVAAVIRDG